MRVGVAFTPFETRADVILRLAAQADELGLHRVDVAEGWTHDATVLLAEIALRTSQIQLGTSVISVWGRTPANHRHGRGGAAAVLGRPVHARASAPAALR